jgi:serine/threonine protein kinase
MLGKLLDRRYQVLQVLSAGGFGRTYIAEDTRRPGNPHCVVKHLTPASNDPNYLETARRLFISEAETLEQLGNHDQIPRLLAYFEENQEFYLVQEFIVGHSLSVELQPNNYWSESQVIQLLQDVLGILAFVHSYGVIHRDIKPDNLIRRASDAKLVLIDFGAVKQVRTQMLGDRSQMGATVAIGTPGYMASEQGLGRPRPSSDIYAVGIIAIQALTGLYPSHLQEDPTTGEIFWQHQAQVSAGLASIVSQMVRYDYRDRYQSANEVLEAIAQLSNSFVPTQLPNRPPSPVSPTQALPVPPARQNAVPVATNSNKLPLLVGVGIAAVVTGATVAYIRSATAPPLISRQTPESTSSIDTGSNSTSTPPLEISPSPDTPKVISLPSPSNSPQASSSNEFDKVEFPQSNCGDSLPTDPASTVEFYPVFIEYSDRNLNTVKSKFCTDAYRTTRKDTGEVAIQVASFNQRSQAELFSDFMKKKIGSGEVGQPTTYTANSTPETPSKNDCSTVVSDPESPLNVRSRPDTKRGEIVGKLENGTSLTVVGEQNGWVQISSPVSGWISKTRTKTVCP